VSDGVAPMITVIDRARASTETVLSVRGCSLGPAQEALARIQDPQGTSLAVSVCVCVLRSVSVEPRRTGESARVRWTSPLASNGSRSGQCWTWRLSATKRLPDQGSTSVEHSTTTTEERVRRRLAVAASMMLSQRKPRFAPQCVRQFGPRRSLQPQRCLHVISSSVRPRLEIALEQLKNISEQVLLHSFWQGGDYRTAGISVVA